MVQSPNHTQFQTFNNLGEAVLRKLMKVLNDDTLGVSDVAVVFDWYDKKIQSNQWKEAIEEAVKLCQVKSSHILESCCT